MLSKRVLLKIGREIVALVSLAIEKRGRKRALGRLTAVYGFGGDQVRQADFLAEKALFSAIERVVDKFKLAEFVLSSEESGVKSFFGRNKKGKRIFGVADPLDGSCNLRTWFSPYPCVGFSLALGHFSRLESTRDFQAVEAGLVKDIFHHKLFWALKNQGAWLNGQRIRVSRQREMETAILGTSLDRGGRQLRRIFQRGLLALLLGTKYQRRLGSTVLDFCQLASGHYDIYVSLGGGVKIHDLAAAQLIIKEAGGVLAVPNRQNSHFFLRNLLVKKDSRLLSQVTFTVVAAANRKLLNQAQKILKT